MKIFDGRFFKKLTNDELHELVENHDTTIR